MMKLKTIGTTLIISMWLLDLTAQDSIQKVVYSCDLWDRNSYELIESSIDTINGVDRFIDADHFYMKQIALNQSIPLNRLESNVHRLSRKERVFGTKSRLLSLVEFILDLDTDFFLKHTDSRGALAIASYIENTTESERWEVLTKLLAFDGINPIDSVHITNIFTSTDYSSDLFTNFQFPEVSSRYIAFFDYEKYRNKYLTVGDSVEVYFTVTFCNKWNKFTTKKRRVRNDISSSVPEFTVIPFDELPSRVKVDKELVFKKNELKRIRFILYPRHYSYAIGG